MVTIVSTLIAGSIEWNPVGVIAAVVLIGALHTIVGTDLRKGNHTHQMKALSVVIIRSHIANAQTGSRIIGIHDDRKRLTVVRQKEVAKVGALIDALQMEGTHDIEPAALLGGLITIHMNCRITARCIMINPSRTTLNTRLSS